MKRVHFELAIHAHKASINPIERVLEEALKEFNIPAYHVSVMQINDYLLDVEILADEDE